MAEKDEEPDRVERLLALLLIQQLKGQGERAVALNIAGFTNTEIADLIQTKAPVVANVLYEARRGKKKARS